jgi:hypothetical protein
VIRQGEQLIPKDGPPDVSDAALIAAAQHVEHYEIAGYGCARTHAKWLDEKHAAELLQQTLDEEGDADHKLTKIAGTINRSAADIARTPPAASSPGRLRYLELELNDLEPSPTDYSSYVVRNREGKNLGNIEGFIVGETGRPYYVVIDSGGWFLGRRYVVPVGKLSLNLGPRDGSPMRSQKRLPRRRAIRCR